MVREAFVERVELQKRYPGIGPILSDRVLYSGGQIAKSGISYVEKNFPNYMGFRLVLDAYLTRRENDEIVADAAFAAAQRICMCLRGKEKRRADADLSSLLIIESGSKKSHEEETTAIPTEENKNENFWKIVQTYSKLADASKIESRKMLGKAIAVLEKMDSNKAQRIISEIEERLDPKYAVLLLLEIMEQEEREEVSNKARAHFIYQLQEIDDSSIRIVSDLKDVIGEPFAIEILRLLINEGRKSAQIRIIECYPEIGINYALEFLDCGPEEAKGRVEVVKGLAEEAGVFSSMQRLLGQLDPYSPSEANLNLAQAILDLINKCDYAIVEGIIEDVGIKATPEAVEVLQFMASEHNNPNVREAAVRALRLTGHERALEIGENCLEDPNPGIRAAAYHAISELSFLNEPLVESICARGAENPQEDARIRLELIRWLGNNGENMGLSALQRMMSKEETPDKLAIAASKAVEQMSERSSQRTSLPAGRKHSRPTCPVPSVPSTRPPVRITPIKKISGPPPRPSRKPK